MLFSVAGVWEMVIKIGRGTLTIAEPRIQIPEQLRKNRIQAMSITPEHALAVLDLPRHHRDPFDRIMIAQCMVESLPFITHDAKIARYDIDIIW